ncbi:hypothetical protein HDU96_001392 [Phlyctochytrium bullatum]|nr:hypothetical protein HDU96_001392 [Phlyctochytrium bullatum]
MGSWSAFHANLKVGFLATEPSHRGKGLARMFLALAEGGGTMHDATVCCLRGYHVVFATARLAGAAKVPLLVPCGRSNGTTSVQNQRSQPSGTGHERDGRLLATVLGFCTRRGETIIPARQLAQPSFFCWVVVDTDPWLFFFKPDTDSPSDPTEPPRPPSPPAPAGPSAPVPSRLDPWRLDDHTETPRLLPDVTAAPGAPQGPSQPFVKPDSVAPVGAGLCQCGRAYVGPACGGFDRS